ncbi:Protein NAP1 [Vitis vinifera]|uniref:Protein NAP1 n=1 Tax=Vitis vinifera TaxID=29760 RepID=A0A438J159_VITVI|nr:Protein NAP1 [Vitis vinifera]
MAKSRQHFANQDASLSPTAGRSREWDGPSRWSEYLNLQVTSPMTSRSHRNVSSDGQAQSSSGSHKGLNMQSILESRCFPPTVPGFGVLLSKKFPEHHIKLQLERVDKVALDALHENAEVHLQSLEPWVQLLLDLMAFWEQALRLILDLSSTVITLLPHQNSLILHAFMDLFCSFVRVNLFSEKASPLHAVLVPCFSFFAKALWLRNFD